MESLQTFADIFGIKELDEQTPDTDTAVHIATMQGMVQRVLYPAEERSPPAGRSVRLHHRRRMPSRLPARPRAVRHRARPSAASTTTSRSIAACSTTSTRSRSA